METHDKMWCDCQCDKILCKSCQRIKPKLEAFIGSQNDYLIDEVTICPFNSILICLVQGNSSRHNYDFVEQM